jgi:glycosyltransferase involved in cell wall biosynthesis
MKVLMLGWELPPHNSGGLGVVCHQLCKALTRRDIAVEFVLPYTANDHVSDFMQVTHACPQDVVEVFQSGGSYDSFLYKLAGGNEEAVGFYQQIKSYEEAVAKIAQQTTFDIIHAHDWMTFRAGLRARQVSGKPLILHVHSVESDRAGGLGGNPLVREIEELGLMLADRIIAVSQHTKNIIMRDYGIPGDKIEVVHNSIEKADMPTLSDHNVYVYLQTLKANGWKVVVNVGRVTIQKGLPNLLLAAQHVVRKSPKTMFLIVGNGEQLEELIELAASLGIGSNVLFAGFQRGQPWRDAFVIGDLFVMPSISEPFGLTPLEAIQYGTPSLISKQSGVSEVIHSCLKVDFWDVDEMANQIASAVDNTPLREELRISLLKEYDGLSWDASVDKLHGIYRQHTDAVRSAGELESVVA